MVSGGFTTDKEARLSRDPDSSFFLVLSSCLSVSSTKFSLYILLAYFLLLSDSKFHGNRDCISAVPLFILGP